MMMRAEVSASANVEVEVSIDPDGYETAFIRALPSSMRSSATEMELRIEELEKIVAVLVSLGLAKLEWFPASTMPDEAKALARSLEEERPLLGRHVDQAMTLRDGRCVVLRWDNDEQRITSWLELPEV